VTAKLNLRHFRPIGPGRIHGPVRKTLIIVYNIPQDFRYVTLREKSRTPRVIPEMPPGVPHRGRTVSTRGTMADNQAVQTRSFASQLVGCDPIDWVSITTTRRKPATQPMALGKPILYAGKEVMTTQLQDFNRNGLESAAWSSPAKASTYPRLSATTGAGYQGRETRLRHRFGRAPHHARRDEPRPLRPDGRDGADVEDSSPRSATAPGDLRRERPRFIVEHGGSATNRCRRRVSPALDSRPRIVADRRDIVEAFAGELPGCALQPVAVKSLQLRWIITSLPAYKIGLPSAMGLVAGFRRRCRLIETSQSGRNDKLGCERAGLDGLVVRHRAACANQFDPDEEPPRISGILWAARVFRGGIHKRSLEVYCIQN